MKISIEFYLPHYKIPQLSLYFPTILGSISCNNVRGREGLYYKHATAQDNRLSVVVCVVWHCLAFLLRIQREMKYGLHKPRVRTGKIKANHKNRFVRLNHSGIDAPAHSCCRNISKHLLKFLGVVSVVWCLLEPIW